MEKTAAREAPVVEVDGMSSREWTASTVMDVVFVISVTGGAAVSVMESLNGEGVSGTLAPVIVYCVTLAAGGLGSQIRVGSCTAGLTSE
jgi:hypothetical protein